MDRRLDLGSACSPVTRWLRDASLPGCAGCVVTVVDHDRMQVISAARSEWSAASMSGTQLPAGRCAAMPAAHPAQPTCARSTHVPGGVTRRRGRVGHRNRPRSRTSQSRPQRRCGAVRPRTRPLPGDWGRERTHGRGMDAVIDAVGMEAHGSPVGKLAQHRSVILRAARAVSSFGGPGIPVRRASVSGALVHGCPSTDLSDTESGVEP